MSFSLSLALFFAVFMAQAMPKEAAVFGWVFLIWSFFNERGNK